MFIKSVSRQPIHNYSAHVMNKHTFCKKKKEDFLTNETIVILDGIVESFETSTLHFVAGLLKLIIINQSISYQTRI